MNSLKTTKSKTLSYTEKKNDINPSGWSQEKNSIKCDLIILFFSI